MLTAVATNRSYHDACLIYGGRDLVDAVAAGRLSVRGDRSAIDGFLRLFALPDPAPVPQPAAAVSRGGLR
jgi:hypothetical protein